MRSQYDYDIIRDYLQGLTSSDNTREIAELIKNDETARTIAKGILLLEQDFKGNEDEIEIYLENFRQTQLKRIESAIKPANTQRLWLKIAASVVLIVAAGVVISLLMNKPNAMQLADAELAEPYPVSTVVRAQGEATAYEKGLESYKAGNYTQASYYFEQANQTEDFATTAFYNALSYLYTQQYNRATELLSSDVIRKSRYSQQALWYECLGYVKAGNNRNAINKLTIIRQQPQHFKYEEAIQILEALE